MSRNFEIKPECEADTVLVEVLGFKKPDHVRGASEVVYTLEREKLSLRKAVGFIDRDKNPPSKLAEYTEIRQFSVLKLLQHNVRKQHYMITHPPLEDWLFDMESRDADIDPSKYGFATKKYFLEVTKNQKASYDNGLRNFFNALKQKSPTLQTLQSWLEELVM